jgi:hypothetical protein
MFTVFVPSPNGTASVPIVLGKEKDSMILQSMALQSDQSVGTRNPCAILLYVYMTLIVLLYEHAPEGPCFMLLTIVSALQARGRACVDVV